MSELEKIKSEFDKLSALFNSRKRGIDRYGIARRLGYLITRYFELTGIRLVKPPREYRPGE